MFPIVMLGPNKKDQWLAVTSTPELFG